MKCSTNSGAPKIDMSPLILVISGRFLIRTVVTTFGKLPHLSWDNTVNNCNAQYFIQVVYAHKDYPVIWIRMD